MLLKRINDFPDYWISLENQQVWSDISGKFLKSIKDNHGYLRISLFRDGKQQCKMIHKLVAEAFVYNPNPNKFIVPDHIDRNPLNNHPDNLRWTTIQKNSHNTSKRNGELNICEDKHGHRVMFNLKDYHISRRFQELEKAITFRDIIQNKIDNDEPVCKVFVELYDNPQKHIFPTRNGKWKIVINKPDLKHYEQFDTLEQAQTKRDELLTNYYIQLND
jgi:hypothetical protein